MLRMYVTLCMYVCYICYVFFLLNPIFTPTAHVGILCSDHLYHCIIYQEGGDRYNILPLRFPEGAGIPIPFLPFFCGHCPNLWRLSGPHASPTASPEGQTTPRGDFGDGRVLAVDVYENGGVGAIDCNGLFRSNGDPKRTMKPLSIRSAISGCVPYFGVGFESRISVISRVPPRPTRGPAWPLRLPLCRSRRKLCFRSMPGGMGNETERHT